MAVVFVCVGFAFPITFGLAARLLVDLLLAWQGQRLKAQLVRGEYACARVRAHVRVCMCVRACVRVRLFVCARVCFRVRVRVCMCACVCACTHAYLRLPSDSERRRAVAVQTAGWLRVYLSNPL